MVARRKQGPATRGSEIEDDDPVAEAELRGAASSAVRGGQAVRGSRGGGGVVRASGDGGDEGPPGRWQCAQDGAAAVEPAVTHDRVVAGGMAAGTGWDRGY